MTPMIARFQNEAALLAEGREDWFKACLTALDDRSGELASEFGDDTDFWDPELAWARPYAVKNGILQIPVKGVLLNDFPYAFGSWATGYEYIWQAFKRGMEDSNVRGIALVIDSPGGMVAGNFDLNDRMFAMRGTKPVRAYATESAYSAAYSIASVADSITVTRSGGVGSIGVVVVQMEISRALDAAGITVNIIRSKPTKMEGNPYEPLSADARARLQNRVDTLGEEFVALVARNRDMKPEEVDATNALCFSAQEAIENGLADEIGALDDAIVAFVASFDNSDNDQGDDQMAEKTEAEKTITVAAHEAAVTQASDQARDEGRKEGAQAAVTRINAIIDSDEGKKRPKAALSAALKTSMTVEEATAFIADLPEEKAAATEQPKQPKGQTTEAVGAGAGREAFERAMDTTQNPNLSGHEGGDGGDDPEAARMARLRDNAAAYGFISRSAN